jgi:2-polyprenyl-3-methyl-5-hydroxy-6-metoxy-1,4-benzoquinol methylase
MSYNSILPIIKKTKSNLTPKQFQERINIAFHDQEAFFYDDLHKDMKESLQEQINLLVDDYTGFNKNISDNLTLLDVGCGTGMSTHLLLNSKLGSKIKKLSLLDTSSNMLKHAEEKAKTWNKEYELLNYDIFNCNHKFDMIVICSVLHHIPNLDEFLYQVDNLLNPYGVLIHLQDPNGDYLNDTDYLERVTVYELENYQKSNNSWKNLIPRKFKNYINRNMGRKSYIDKVNDILIAEKTIIKRMTADDIWCVTDIHVESKNNSMNKGISLKRLKNQLNNFELIKSRSYGFFGPLKSELSEKFKKVENDFIINNEPSGRNLSCIWIKKNV